MSIETSIARLEWDDPSINKRDWPAGAWLNEPDKVQLVSDAGNPRLILRAHHGALCGYVGVPRTHPAYGYSYNGYSQLLADIISAEHMDKMREWGNRGYPKDENGLPDVGWGDTPDPSITPVGQAILDIRVHGGLTYSGPPTTIDEATWRDLLSGFPKAKAQAQLAPLGDAARWLHRWRPAEHDFEAFTRICQSSAICFDPPDNDIWLFGFDCAHAGDRTPAIEAIVGWHTMPLGYDDVYRTMEYVEAECENLAKQLKTIEVLSKDLGAGSSEPAPK